MPHYPRLRDLREDRDLTQEQIAEVLGISRSFYNRYETGRIQMPIHHFVTLARYYNVSLDYLTGLIDTPRALYKK